MNADASESMNTGGRDVVNMDGRDVVNADPVYEAELVEEPPRPVYYRPRLGRFSAWWLRSPRVPVWLKSRAHAKQAVKDAAVAVLRSPFRYLGAVLRGLIAAARWWRRWVTVRDFREAAELSEKLADKFTEIRALTLFRWKVTGAVVVSAVVGLLIVELIYGRRALWITAAVASLTLAILGRRKDGSPGRKAVLAGPRTLTWTMDPKFWWTPSGTPS